VTTRRRKILHAALEYAVDLELLDKNPMPALKWTPPKTTHGVDRRRVANPIQARTLLYAVGQQRGGRRLVAFFGCLYYAALRPEEAISLAKHNRPAPRPHPGVRSPARRAAVRRRAQRWRAAHDDDRTGVAARPTGRVHRRGRRIAAGEDTL
jgi:hypothetical protein